MTRIVLIAVWLAILTLGVAGRAWLPANADVSWLLTVVEKWLDGGRLYIDMLENNPPMAVYLYAPEVLLGRALSISPERMVDIFVFGLGALSVLWSGARLPREVADAGSARPFLAPAAFAIIAVMPAFTFGEREHFALIFFLPWLAMSIRRAQGASVNRIDSVVAGVAGGLVVSIKPHFALALLAASAAAAIQVRSWRPIFALENWVAGALVAAYLALSLIHI